MQAGTAQVETVEGERPPVWQREGDPRADTFYRRALNALGAASVPFLVGGAYSLERYTGIARDTKDFDLFVQPADAERALTVLAGIGCRTELTFPHWLSKAFYGDSLIDVIFSSSNGIGVVDDGWFAHATLAEVLGVPVRLCPVEETIWQKAFIMEKERYDGADVAHLLRAQAATLDWPRLLRRFAGHRRVLLAHLILFGYIYPAERDLIPAAVLDALFADLRSEPRPSPGDERLCRGPFLSRLQYLVDIERDGYRDARLTLGYVSEPDAASWTEAALDDE